MRAKSRSAGLKMRYLIPIPELKGVFRRGSEPKASRKSVFSRKSKNFLFDSHGTSPARTYISICIFINHHVAIMSHAFQYSIQSLCHQQMQGPLGVSQMATDSIYAHARNHEEITRKCLARSTVAHGPRKISRLILRVVCGTSTIERPGVEM